MPTRVARLVTTFVNEWMHVKPIMILPTGSFAGAFTVVLAAAVFLLLKVGFRVIGCCLFKTLPEANAPHGIKKLTDHVWQFHSPVGIPEQEIIFFHGLQLRDFKDAFWETWVTEKDKQCVWPKEWLSKKFPHARILSVSYNSSATESAGQLRIYALAENLYSDIILGTKHKIGQNCPVFLVGHCFGGIVIKHFILFAKNKEDFLRNDSTFQRDFKKTNTFLKNFTGVFYYATPHGGSEVANLARLLPGTSSILELVKTLSTDTATTNEDFRRHRQNLNARAFGVAEGLAFSYFKGFKAVVVEESSTRQDIDYFYTHSTADHFSICKATDEEDPTVIEKLAQFIQDNVPEELKELANVNHQSEGENKNSPEEPQSYLGSATPKLSEKVVKFISLLNDERRLSYDVSRKWWDELEKEETKALMSEIEENGYTLMAVSCNNLCCSRNEDNKQG